MKDVNQLLQKYGGKFRYGSKLHPVRDWSILVTIAAVLIGISIGWNAWLFIEAGSGKLTTSAVVAPDHADAPVNIAGVQDVFKKKATEESAYQSAYNFVDPSTQGS